MRILGFTILSALITQSAIAAPMNIQCHWYTATEKSQTAIELELKKSFGESIDLGLIKEYEIKVAKTITDNGISIALSKGEHTVASAGELDTPDSNVSIYVQSQASGDLFSMQCKQVF